MAFTKSILATLAVASLCNAYQLVAEHKGLSFFEGFDFFTDVDPTNGTVSYVNFTTAIADGLVGAVPQDNHSEPAIYIGVDYTNPSTSQRPSVRVTSKKSYNHALVLADVLHMPTGCGVWPALWMVGPNWPSSGEIDILEQVNGNVYNTATLHTSANCAISNASSMAAGELITADCDVNSPSQSKNAGCSFRAPDNETFTLDGSSCEHATAGPAFNTDNGGVIAMLWESSAITIWFFPREYIPNDIRSNTPNPANWTQYTPQAKFQGCDFDAHLKDLQLVINTDFCGDWAGNTWGSDGCAARTGVQTCDEFVLKNPQAFTEAYWLFGGISVFQNATGY